MSRKWIIKRESEVRTFIETNKSSLWLDDEEMDYVLNEFLTKKYTYVIGRGGEVIDSKVECCPLYLTLVYLDGTIRHLSIF
jgi:hypothetical protein